MAVSVSYEVHEKIQRMPQNAFQNSRTSTTAAQQFHDAAQASSGSQHPIRVGNYAVQQPRKSFQGASEGHLDELIQACNQPRAVSGGAAALTTQTTQTTQTTRPNDGQDVGGGVLGTERTLVPFFSDASAGEGGSNPGAFDWPAGGKGIGVGGKGVGKGGTVSKGAANGNTGRRQQQHGDTRKKKGQNQVKSPKHAGGPAPHHQQQHQHQRPSHVHSNQRSAASRYAGSSFTVSPSADRLPMPSKLL